MGDIILGDGDGTLILFYKQRRNDDGDRNKWKREKNGKTRKNRE
jgi:hypothetical protein